MPVSAYAVAGKSTSSTSASLTRARTGIPECGTRVTGAGVKGLDLSGRYSKLIGPAGRGGSVYSPKGQLVERAPMYIGTNRQVLGSSPSRGGVDISPW